MSIKMDFSLTEEPEEVSDIDEHGELHVLSQQLSVRAQLVSGANQEETHMHASATVSINTACKATKDADGVADYMRMNGLSIAYGHTRSCIAGMTSLSPMGQFIVPAVDPKTLLEDLTSDEE